MLMLGLYIGAIVIGRFLYLIEINQETTGI